MKLNRIGIGTLVASLTLMAQAYGPTGHKLVGEIADELLDGKPAETKISNLLDGMSLGEAALIPDNIKDWDTSPPSSAGFRPVTDSHEIEQQLEDFWEANSEPGASGEILHHEFHYTDVPVKRVKKYDDGETGRSPVDVVHMIQYCVKVLRGQTSAHNSFKITKPVAVILLAHYVGDLHQPLHVGAEYFTSSGKVMDPDDTPNGRADNGGNTLRIDFVGVDPGTTKRPNKLHHFWDNDAVNEGLRQAKRKIHPGNVKHTDLVKFFATQHPDCNCDPSVDVNEWPVRWANEILPIAVQAHDRLEFVDMVPGSSHGHPIERGLAQEKASANHTHYLQWSGEIVEVELGKAGFRLAAILEQALK